MRCNVLIITAAATLVALSAPTQADMLAIGNAGFEDPAQGDGSYTFTIGIWGHIGNADTRGVWNPPAAGYGGVAPEGQNIGFAQGSNGTEPNPSYPGGFAQVLAGTLTANTHYELSVQVGHNYYYTGGMYAIELLAGGSLADNGGQITTGTFLAGISGAIDDDVPFDTFELMTVPFNSTGVDAGLLGQNLQIRLYVTAGGEVDFDDVKLSADVIPEPASLALLGLGALCLMFRRRRR